LVEDGVEVYFCFDAFDAFDLNRLSGLGLGPWSFVFVVGYLVAYCSLDEAL